MKRTIITLLACTVVLSLSAQFLTFSNYEKALEGTVKGGGTATMNLVLAYPENKNPQDINAMRSAISSIVNESALATEFGQVLTNQPISRMADFYVAAFTRGLRTGATYPMTYYVLNIVEEYQTERAVTFHVTDGIFGNGGPLAYYRTVRRSDGHVLNNGDLVRMNDGQLRALLRNYFECESEFDAECINNLTMSDVRCSILNGGMDILWAVSSHFTQDVIIPHNAIQPYLTEQGRSLF